MSQALDRPVLWRPSARQELFLSAPEDEVLYGGSSGGGKTDSLTIDALGLHQNAISVPRYRAILIRRTFTEMTDLIDRTKSLYPVIVPGAVYREQAKQWQFPSGAKVIFASIEREDDTQKYQGQEYQYCCGAGTPVLMADGAYRAIETIQAGDFVQTLEGPRAVTATPPSRRMALLAVTAAGLTTLVGAEHVALTCNGWASLSEPIPKRSHPERRSCECATASSEALPLPEWSPSTGPARRPAHVPPTAHRTDRPETCGGAAGDRSGCVASEHSRQAASPPRRWSVPLVLYAPAHPSEVLAGLYDWRRHDADHAHAATSAPSSPGGCRSAFRSCDAPPHRDQAVGQSCLPSRGDAAPPCLTRHASDDLGNTLEYSRRQSLWWPHPYTKDVRSSRARVLHAEADICPAGEGEVFDLRIASAAHYITFGGMISRNCGFEELTNYPTSYAWDFMRTRLRGTHLKLYMRATCNPGGVGGKWVQARWRIPDDGSAVSHTVSVTVPGTKGEPDRTTEVRLRFIPARVSDNPHISASYAANLMRLPDQQRRALLDGRWDVYDVPGAIYAAELGAMRDQGRISRVPYDPASPVYTAWDLGIGDSTSIWFLQLVGREVHLISFYEASGEGLGHFAGLIADKRDRLGWRFARHYLPHDVQARELMTGAKTRQAFLIEQKIGPVVVVKRGEVEDGIHAVRMLLPRAWIDAEGCRDGIDALTNYRRAYNSMMGQFQAAPVHDSWSHGCDALRCLAMGLTAERTVAPSRPREHVPMGPGSWMGR